MLEEKIMSTTTTGISRTATYPESLRARNKKEIIYPDSDGKPMADNTKQFEIIVTLHTGISGMFAGRPDVFVAGDLLWYPVEGNNTLRMAPDVMVAFGRPPGHRGSYRQWCENNIAPQVVFEIMSPGNRAKEMSRKFHFYEKYGVEEYYIHDPDRGRLDGWLRQSNQLEKIPEMEGWTSPRLGIRFHLDDNDLVVYRPDGNYFETAIVKDQKILLERHRAQKAEQRAEAERQRAEAERQRAETEYQRAEAERQRVQRLADQLRALGINPDNS
ncbi:Uma2 family endonuclease [Gammaproteobacteria bacterium]